MNAETKEFLIDWRATYGELHPDREPDAMNYTDAMLAMGVLLRREILIRKYPPRFAEGIDPQPSARGGRRGGEE